MKRILCIPHHPGLDKIKIRATEMVKPLTAKHDVFVMDWGYVEGKRTFLKRLKVYLKDLFKIPRFYKKFNMTIVELPVMHSPAFAAKLFNRFWVMRFIKKNKIDVVFNGSFHVFTFPEKRKFKYIYDLCDFPADGITKDTLNEVAKSDTCTVVSTILSEHIRKQFNQQTVFIPNGAYLNEMHSISKEEIATIKKRYNLENKFLIGYIGFIGSWVNIELAVNAFRIFQKEAPESALVFIGMSDRIDDLRKKYGARDIIFTGGIAESIDPYFNMLDIGMLPHKKSFFQDCAFHLKLIEFTAARKPVVSTPLEESMRLGLPNVLFANEKPEEWADAFKKARYFKWDPEWDEFIVKYDWKNVGEILNNIIENNDKKILIIPHHPELLGVKIRLIEMAKALACRHEVFLLNWKSVQGAYTLKNRIIVTLKDLFKFPKLYKNGAVTVIEFPTLHRPVFLAHLFNRLFLMRFIRENNIDIVINGSYYLFTLPKGHGLVYFVDLADLPAADESADFVSHYTQIEASKANIVTTASNALADYARANYSKNAVFIPNGFDRVKMNAVTPEAVLELKNQYGVLDNFIIGYIGNIGDWMDIDMAVRAFKRFKETNVNSVMMWIGRCSEIERMKQRYGSRDIIFTGSINVDVEQFFRLIDVGIIPSKQSKFQDNAFHIKLVEYTAARKPVISTYSKESEMLGFPNVLFCENDEAQWAKAYQSAKNMKWKPEWDSLSRQFDWESIMLKYDKLFTNPGNS